MGPDTRTEVVVVGLGAMGSAVLYQLAKAGVPAVGVDRTAASSSTAIPRWRG